MNRNQPFSDLVAAYDAKSLELEAARLEAEAAWAEYETLAAEVVKLTNRWGPALRRYKELVPEERAAEEQIFALARDAELGVWAWLKRLFGV
jgi:hypothetical protein